MKRTIFAAMLCLVAFSFKAEAQTSPVPENYSLKIKDDYAKYEPDVIKTIDWLQQTPWNEAPERKQANAFLMAWLTGSPSVNINMNADVIMKYCSKNGELLMSFMGGYTKFVLQHKNDFTTTQCDVAGVKAMVDKYGSDPGRVKDKAMEMLVKLDKGGKLEDWVKTDFEKK